MLNISIFHSRLYISTRAFSHATCINIHASAFRTITVLEYCGNSLVTQSEPLSEHIFIWIFKR
jgi:hypothetical protein